MCSKFPRKCPRGTSRTKGTILRGRHRYHGPARHPTLKLDFDMDLFRNINYHSDFHVDPHMGLHQLIMQAAPESNTSLYATTVREPRSLSGSRVHCKPASCQQAQLASRAAIHQKACNQPSRQQPNQPDSLCFLADKAKLMLTASPKPPLLDRTQPCKEHFAESVHELKTRIVQKPGSGKSISAHLFLIAWV